MDLRHIEIYSWYLGTLVEALVILRIARWRPPYRFPLFLTFLAWDWARAVVMIPISIYAPAAYTYVFAETERLDIALLCAAGIEAWACAGKIEPPPWMYTGIITVLVLLGVLLPSAHIIPLAPLFVARTLVTGSFAIALPLTMAWHRRAPLHAVILAAYVIVDASAYLGILLGSPRYHPESYVMVSQLVCWIAWCVFARNLD